MDNNELEAYLRQRLFDREDSYVERKSRGVQKQDIAKAISAFANSLTGDEKAVFFVGIEDKTDDITGVPKEEIEKIQQSIQNVCLQNCYPEIKTVKTVILPVDGKFLVAALVSASCDRPHFTGHAYVRRGPRSEKASADQFNDLIASRNDKAGRILQMKGKTISIAGHGRRIIHSLPVANHREQGECIVTDCDAHRVCFTLLDRGLAAMSLAEPLSVVDISYDTRNQRDMLIIRTS